MLYFIYRVDKPDSLDLRKATRPDHLEYAAAIADKIILAGPTKTEDGVMDGSVFVIEAENRTEAEALTAEDPFEKAGLFESKVVREFMQVIPKP